MKTAYYNDRIMVKKKKGRSFIPGGYKTTYKDNFVKVKILGTTCRHSPSGSYHYFYLIELPDKSRQEVYREGLFTERGKD